MACYWLAGASVVVSIRGRPLIGVGKLVALPLLPVVLLNKSARWLVPGRVSIPNMYFIVMYRTVLNAAAGRIGMGREGEGWLLWLLL
jgi:hypothetical protein